MQNLHKKRLIKPYQTFNPHPETPSTSQHPNPPPRHYPHPPPPPTSKNPPTSRNEHYHNDSYDNHLNLHTQKPSCKQTFSLRRDNKLIMSSNPQSPFYKPFHTSSQTGLKSALNPHVWGLFLQGGWFKSTPLPIAFSYLLEGVSSVSYQPFSVLALGVGKKAETLTETWAETPETGRNHQNHAENAKTETIFPS